MKALKKRVFMKPIIAVELLLVVLLAGAGVAFALTVHTIMPGTEPWAGEATITESGNLSVTDYSLVYSGELTEVTGVTVEVTNGDASAHTADINVAILDSGGVLRGSGTAADGTINGSTTTDVTVDLGSNVALADVGKLNIILTDKG